MPLTREVEKDAFWALPVPEVAQILQTDLERGVSEKEAESRLKLFGENIIEKPHRARVLLIFLNQFKSPLVIILIAAVLVTLLIGHYRDALFILAAVVVNAALGFHQEYTAEKALAELKTYLKQRARVIRGGIEREIDASGLVPGDLIRLSQGDRVPADVRILFANDVQVDEAILTGESLPVSKSADPVPLEAVLADQLSMAFAGTLVTQGIATTLVCRTDFATELGKIAVLVAESKREATPLQAAISRFSKKIGLILCFLTFLVFGLGISFGYSMLEMFVVSVAVAVSAVPESLPIAMTVILAIGVQRMARRKGVIRRLIAAETLGSTTIILTDKTGTLTMAKMELDALLPIRGGVEQSKRLLELALVNSDVFIENKGDQPVEWRMNGRVIEVALVRSAGMRGVNIDVVKKNMTVLHTLPFNAVNKFSASLVRERGRHSLIFLGAPDVLVDRTSLNVAQKEEIKKHIDELADSGRLVLGVATKKIGTKGDLVLKEKNFSRISFEGLITLRDPVRPSVKDAIRRVEESGIRTVIVTGDHRGTANVVAREVGMSMDGESSIDAVDLRALSDDDIKNLLPRLSVVARVSPEDKLRIMRLFQEMGEVVAMTGDGVNDAPSIKQADIGIAMGSGTEVARDVADLVLLDDNFETIAAAVEEGRQVMKNIKKVMVYLLSNVADTLFLIGGSLLAGLALPVNALQILWVNFFADSFPAIAFAFERQDMGSLSDRPQNARNGLFDPLMKFLVLFIGLATSILLFFLYWILIHLGFPEDLVKTFIFACLGSYALVVAFPVRSLERSILGYPMFSNRYMIFGVGVGLVLMGLAVYMPFLQSVFETVALPPMWLLGVVVVWAVNIFAIEFGKWLFRRGIVR